MTPDKSQVDGMLAGMKRRMEHPELVMLERNKQLHASAVDAVLEW